MAECDAAAADSGAMELYAGYHAGLLPGTGSAPSDVDPERVDSSRRIAAVTEPGDILVLHSLAPHFSGPNRSQRSRRVIFFGFSAGEEDLYDRYYATRP